MYFQTTSSTILRFILVLAICAGAFFLLIKASLSPAKAVGQERIFEDAIPKNAPIRIKIKKEKEQSFKDLKNEKWVREFELELTNTGDKPIYYAFIDLVTDVKIGDTSLVFSLVFGRTELGDIVTPARVGDSSIKPGETYVFKIHPGQVPAWEHGVATGGHSEATRIKARLEMLSFGDGTGFFLNKPYPRSNVLQSKIRPTSDPPNRQRADRILEPTVRPNALRMINQNADRPVTFAPALFLPSISNTLTAVSANPMPSDNCLFDLLPRHHPSHCKCLL